MYLSRIQLRSDADPRKLIGLNGYREHQALWKLFDPDADAKRDFLFRRDGPSDLPVYYLVSAREPSDRDNLWQVEIKSYAPSLQAGQTLAFSLRANPIVTRTDAQGRSRRNDLVMDAKRQMNWRNLSNSERPQLAQLVQQAGEQWLAGRQNALGATFQSIQADAYQRHRSFKRTQERPIQYSSLDLTGTLTVTDAEKMENALFNGIGPAKAFGCGLLLVRRL